MDFRECSLEFFSQHRHDGVFRMEMTGVDQGDAQILGIPELIVLHIGGDEGVAAGIE